MEIENGEVKTDENGEFEIDFKAIPDLSISPENEPTFNYTVNVDITDINGETRSNSISVSVGYVALKLSINTPNDLPKEKEGKFEISTNNLSGAHVNAKGELKIFRLNSPERLFRDRLWARPDEHTMSKAEYYDSFPYDIYEQENEPQNWTKGKEVLVQAFDTDKDRRFQNQKLKILEER